MIVLDTNVLSELARPRPAVQVVRWVDSQDPTQLAVTAVTAAEIRAGIELMPSGRRRDDIERRMDQLLTGAFDRRVYPFDAGSSGHYARAVATRTRSGHPIGALDAQIAAICLQHGAELATRNTDDFTGVGLTVINPWDQTEV